MTRDTARLRAARLSSRTGQRLFVWDWNPTNGLRRVKASAEDGVVRWYRPCASCAERGCDACEYLGSVPDRDALAERSNDAL